MALHWCDFRNMRYGTKPSLVGTSPFSFVWILAEQMKLFLGSAFLNMQWSQSGAPQTIYEKLIFWTIVGISYSGGYKYLMIGAYLPLIPLWYATTFQLIGWKLSSPPDSVVEKRKLANVRK
jgi:hypothetical protein